MRHRDDAGARPPRSAPFTVLAAIIAGKLLYNVAAAELERGYQRGVADGYAAGCPDLVEPREHPARVDD
jgi:hypothetical protein